MNPEAMLETLESLRRSGSAKLEGGRVHSLFATGLSPLVLIPIRFEFRLDHWWLWLAEARGEGGARLVETVHLRRNGRLYESLKAEKKSEDFHSYG
jgi:hypothetical protein